MANILQMVSDQDLLPPVVFELGERFERAGHTLSLVGGPVRDLFLGRTSGDFDFTTDAEPDEILAAVTGWAEGLWDIGRAFGTIGLTKHGLQIEITTYRAEAYAADSRKPEVRFGESLEDDLFRRDFTVNAMALRLPSLELVDPYGGVRDLASKVLRTPGAPEDSFSDDPLRMMRAARFASQLDVEISPEVEAAMKDMAPRLEIISAERVRDELVKLINGARPDLGVDILVRTGLADIMLPEIPALKLQSDEHHRHKDVYEHSLTVLRQACDLETDDDGAVPAPDFILRFAALMHDVGKPATRRFEANGAVTFRNHDLVGSKIVKRRMKELRFDNDSIKAVARLVELHMRFFGYGEQQWTDSAVRRYVTDAGPLLERLHRLTRSDVTTRNKKKAARLAHAYDDLEQRIADLAEQEEMASIRPDLDGQQIMELLGLQPGPLVGKAYRWLLELRLEEGPLGEEEAASRLRQWWAERAAPAPTAAPAPADPAASDAGTSDPESKDPS